MKFNIENGNATVYLEGRISSENVGAVENEITANLPEDKNTAVVFNAKDLEYISSAGLRMILRVKKNYPNFQISEVNSEVYEIFEMTGFTEMMDVKKAYREISVEGCEVIGEGFNGKVYRIDDDNVVKTYKNADALSDIQHEREMARLALILGVPTAISYDIVKVGDSYGSVFELLDAKSFSKILATEPDKFSWCVDEYVATLKKMHSITAPEGKFPSAKEKTLGKIENIKDILPDGLGDKLLKMAKEIPDDKTLIHGDFHTKNLVLSNGEVLIIDMDTLAYGHPIFELAPMYNAYVGYSEYDENVVLNFQGYSAKVARKFWKESLKKYLGTDSDDLAREVEDKVRCISYASLLSWNKRHKQDDENLQKANGELWKSRLIELLSRVSDLDFEVKRESSALEEITVSAEVNNLQKVIDFVNEKISPVCNSEKTKMQLEVAVEEIFVNIASYAYPQSVGKATVSVKTSDCPALATISFVDGGVPYNPLAKEDPDVTLSASERQIGGLGIFMTKKIADDIKYEYSNGKNVLTITKRF